MKTKLTVTIDDDLLEKAKQHARSNGISLFQLIETGLRMLTSESRPSFSERWRGRFEAADRKSERYDALAKKGL